MSTQTNNAYVIQSLNGIISIEDGAGATMEGGVITANELIIDAIQSKSPPNVVSLFTNTTTSINMGSSTSTLNISNINTSKINTNYIQPISTGNVSLFTETLGGYVEVHIGNTTGSNTYIDSPLITMQEILGQSTISTTELKSDIIQPGSNANAICYIYTNTSMDQITMGRTGTICYMNSSLYCQDGIQTTLINTSTINASTAKIKTINCSNIASVGGNITQLQVSELNSTFARILGVTTKYIEPDASEITNDAFLYTTTTEGIVSIATGLTTGALNIGNELSTGSLSMSKGTININPKTLLNMGNQLTTGTANMFNASTFTGTVNFANTSNLSGTRNTINFGSVTSNINMSGRINIGTTNDDVNISGRDIKINSGSNRPIVIGSLQSSNNTIIGGYAAAGLALGTSISTGNIEMGTYLTTGYIEIGSPSSNSFVDIYSRTGRIGIGDFNQFNGTVNIAATANVSNASTSIINIGSATTSTLVLGSNSMAGSIALRTAGNLNLGAQSNQIQMGTSQVATNTISIGTTAASTLNLNCPITPNYNASYNATNGAGVNTNVGYIYNNSTSPASFSLATNDAFYNCQQITLVDPGVYMIWIDNKLYNDNVGGSIVLYYMRVMVGTTLGGTNVFSGYFNSYAQLFNATSPNSQIDSPFTLPYVNTTANQILYTRIRVGRDALGLYWDTSSYIKAVRIA